MKFRIKRVEKPHRVLPTILFIPQYRVFGYGGILGLGGFGYDDEYSDDYDKALKEIERFRKAREYKKTQDIVTYIEVD